MLRTFFIFLLSLVCSLSCARRIPDQELKSNPIERKLEKVYAKSSFYTSKEFSKNFIPKGIVIVIDPGHGGRDPGAKSCLVPVVYEKNLVLSTAKVTKEYLEKLGYEVFLTRKEDQFLTLSDRVRFSIGKKAYLFVSIHYNAANNRAAHGIEVYAYTPPKGVLVEKRSKELAKHVLDGLIGKTGAFNRGVRHGDFHVLRENRVLPSILVEGGFLTNNTEVVKIRSKQYQDKVAQGIAQGVDRFIRKEQWFLLQ